MLDERASADTTYPTLSVVQPVVTDNHATVRWSASDDESGLQIEQATLDSESAKPQLLDNGTTVELAPGMHTLEVLAQDRAGNTVVKTTSFVVGNNRVYLAVAAALSVLKRKRRSMLRLFIMVNVISIRPRHPYPEYHLRSVCAHRSACPPRRRAAAPSRPPLP